MGAHSVSALLIVRVSAGKSKKIQICCIQRSRPDKVTGIQTLVPSQLGLRAGDRLQSDLRPRGQCGGAYGLCSDSDLRETCFTDMLIYRNLTEILDNCQ